MAFLGRDTSIMGPFDKGQPIKDREQDAASSELVLGVAC
jgi:hypothetical protein